MGSRTCIVCNKNAEFSCGGCKLVNYCGKDHQKQDWKTVHKTECKPKFRLETSERFGRYLVANRDIKKGELIFQEPPLVIGPKAVTYPVCLGCHKQISDVFRNCDGCGYPLCSVHCQVSDAHFDECQVMMKRKYAPKVQHGVLNYKNYCHIVPMRIILLKEKQPDKYKKIQDLESHLQERLKSPLYQVFKQNVSAFLRERLGFDSFEESTILNVAAVLDTNAFDVRTKDTKMRALYGTAAMSAHDCVPNTRHTFHGPESSIAVSAVIDIKEGEPITTTYTQSFWSTLARRAHLRSVKYFDCTCRRCSDPTELGSFIGAFRCSHCASADNFLNGPKMVSSDPLVDNAPWKCQECGHLVPAKLVLSGNDNLTREITRLDKSQAEPFEEFLIKYGVESTGILHPTNSFVVQVKHALIQLYGNRPGLTYAGTYPTFSDLGTCQPPKPTHSALMRERWSARPCIGTIGTTRHMFFRVKYIMYYLKKYCSIFQNYHFQD